MDKLLSHVVYDVCNDPDCEIHNIAAGLDEETVTQTDLAFFIAGARWAASLTEKGDKDPLRSILSLADRFGQTLH